MQGAPVTRRRELERRLAAHEKMLDQITTGLGQLTKVVEGLLEATYAIEGRPAVPVRLPPPRATALFTGPLAGSCRIEGRGRCPLTGHSHRCDLAGLPGLKLSPEDDAMIAELHGPAHRCACMFSWPVELGPIIGAPE